MVLTMPMSPTRTDMGSRPYNRINSWATGEADVDAVECTDHLVARAVVLRRSDRLRGEGRSVGERAARIEHLG